MAARDLVYRDFSGGTNARDWPSELSPNEFPYSLNVTIDERGYAQKRLGYEDRYGAAIGSGVVSNLFYWATSNAIVAQIGSSLHKDGAASFKTFSTSDRCGMCEFAGSVFITHPIDGCFLYDGVTVTAVPTGPKGNSCATWQNRVWVNDLTAPPRLWRSDVGTAATFGVGNFTDIREKDSAQIRCITGSSGLDIAGRPGLLVFKDSSAYRINDPSTGGYQTIDPSVGCGSNIGGVSAYGRTYVISTRGIYSTDGLSPCREESRLMEPLFNKLQINQSRPDLYCAGRYQDRLWFSLPRAGASSNSIALEYHPESKWIVAHTNAASAYAILTQTTDLVFGSPTTNRIYNLAKGGSDAGVAISSAFQTRWAEPADGRKGRLRKARFVGRGTFQADYFKDYQSGPSQAASQVNINPGGLVWNEGNWNEAEWGPLFFQSYQTFWSLGTCRALSVYISETSSISTSGLTVAGGVVPTEIGAWELAYIDFLTYDLGTF